MGELVAFATDKALRAKRIAYRHHRIVDRAMGEGLRDAEKRQHLVDIFF